jgi:antitoxin ParD1/3/4
MPTMNISLPDELKVFVERQAAEGAYSSTSEYVRALIREAQRRKAQESLEALLLEGINSGKAVESTPEYWEDFRRRLKARLGKPHDDGENPAGGTARS